MAAASAPGDDRSLRRAARGSILNLLGSVVSGVATFAMTVAVTRLSAPEAAGVFFSATSLFILASGLGRLGTNTGLVYFISRARARGLGAYAGEYMRVAARPVAIVAVVMAVGLFLAAEPLGQLLSHDRAGEFAGYMRAMAVFVPLAAIANLAMAGTQGLGTMKVYVAMEHLARPLLQLGLVTLFLALTWTHALPIAWSVAYLPVAVVAWLWWRRLSHRQGRPLVPEGRVSRTFWMFTAPRALASVSQVAMQRLDIILVGALAGLAEAAVYTAATRFLVLGQMAGRAISMSVQPLLGEALGRADLADAKRLYQVCTTWLILGTWPIYILLMSFSHVVLVIFGSGYDVADQALLVLCGAMLFATACGTVDMVLNMAGKSLWNLVNVLIAFAVNLTLDLILIPQLGFMGAAIGWAGAILVANLLPLFQVMHTPGLHPFGRPTLLAMGASALCFGVLPYGASAVADGDGTVTAVAVGAGCVLYLGFLLVARRVLELGLLVTALRRRRR